MKSKSILLFLTICSSLILLSSCQIVYEVHYLKIGENYYKLNVRSTAIASKSRYMAGYYDESAVDNYFNEMSQKDSLRLLYKKKKVNGKLEEEAFCNDKNTDLVMILSTNSDVVTEQIGNLAQNEQMLEMLARLANKDKIEENKKLNEDITELINENSAIISTGDIYINSLLEDDTINMDLLLNYINFVSSLKDYNFYFDSIQEATDWLNENE